MTHSLTAMLAKQYRETRFGDDVKNWSQFPVGDKLMEEVEELREALAVYNLAPSISAHGRDVRLEIGDVAGALAWIAHCQGVTIEECMVEKFEKDKGRGPGPRYKQGR